MLLTSMIMVPTLFANLARAQIVDPYDVRVFQSCNHHLNVSGFPGVANTASGGSYLVLAAVTVLDDGEHEWTEPADIGLHVFGGPNYQQKIRGVRMYGFINTGRDGDGSLKLEWDDNCSMQYSNFAILRLGATTQCVRVVAAEGDDVEFVQGADDVVFDGVVCPSQLSTRPVQVPHTCDIPGQCASLWFAVQGTEPSQSEYVLPRRTGRYGTTSPGATDSAGSGLAQLTFNFVNLRPASVDVQFYSLDRPGYVWPSGESVWTILHAGPSQTTLNCQVGERVCYGAWFRGNPGGPYWGTGFGGSMPCTNCCAVCGSGAAANYTLQ